MGSDRLPDRLPSSRSVPARIADAATSPASIGAAIGGALGMGLASGWAIASILAGALAGFLVALAITLARHRDARPRAPRRSRIDPFAVGEPWRHFVKGALQARNRFEEAIARSPEGPLRERLTDMLGRVDTAVEDVWAIARQAQDLTRARRDLDVPGMRARLAEIDHAGTAADDPALESLRSQARTADRLDAVIAASHERLAVIEARLGEAVATGIELSLAASSDQGTLGLWDNEIDSVVADLEALRQAMGETGELPPGRL